MLTGNADHFDQENKVESFVTDCGSTDISEKMIECQTCSHCCNKVDGCLELATTWPGDGLRSLKSNYHIEPVYAIILIMTASFVVLLLISIGIMLAKVKLPSTQYPFKDFQKNSMYRFFLGFNMYGIFFATLTILFQIVTTIIFFKAGDITSMTNDWAYPVR